MISFNRFRGERWLVDKFALGKEFATKAHNCWLSSSSIDPIRRGYKVPDTTNNDYRFISSFYQFEDKLIASDFDVPFVESVGADIITRRVYFLFNNLLQHLDYAEVPNGVPTNLINGHRVGVPQPLRVTNVSLGGEPHNGPLINADSADPGFVSGSERGDPDVSVTSIIYTYVNKYGEEGPGSFRSNDLYIRDGSARVRLRLIVVEPITTAYPDIIGIRAYHAIDGEYELIGNPSVTHNGVPNLTHVFTAADRGNLFIEKWMQVDRGQSNELYVTQEWDIAPTGMRHLIDIGNGMFMGADNYNIYFCEPYFPHAWPRRYRRTMQSKILGLAPISGGAVVFTEKGALPLLGTHPEYINERPFTFPHPIRDKRSITQLDDGSVAYVTDEGIALVSANGGEIITDGWIDRDVWLQKVSPDRCRCAFYEGRIVMLTQRPEDDFPTGFVFNLQQAEVTEFDTSFHTYNAGFFRQPLNNELWMVLDNQGIAVFNRGDQVRYEWTSGKIELPHALSLSTARAELDEYLQFPDEARLIIDADGRRIYKEVINNKKLRISPTGRKYWITVSLNAKTRWSLLRLGTNLSDV